MSLCYQACGGVAARQGGVVSNHPVGGEGGGGGSNQHPRGLGRAAPTLPPGLTCWLFGIQGV
ncbi:hypothetical protein ES705_30340 [subsurface metagenome]